MKRTVLALLFTTLSLMAYPQALIDDAYDLQIDVTRLSERLSLTIEQTQYMDVITTSFNRELANAKDDKTHRKAMKLTTATRKHLKQVRKVLRDEQYDLYARMLFTTIRNNFVNKFEDELVKGRHFNGREVHRNQK